MDKSQINITMSAELALTLLDFAARATLTRHEWKLFEMWDTKIRDMVAVTEAGESGQEATSS